MRKSALKHPFALLLALPALLAVPLWPLSASADLRVFHLEWSGASFANTATASGQMTIEDSLLLNPGFNDTQVTPGLVRWFTITISGASGGNGTFGLGDFGRIILGTGLLAIDFSGELVGQPTEQDPWGTSQPGDTGGDFNVYFSSPAGPNGTDYFQLTANEGAGDRMLLTSFGPAPLLSQTDRAQRYAWGENIGWANAGATGHMVRVHFDGSSGWLSGYGWGENIGWLRMGSSGGGPFVNTTSNNWGVNLAANGDLSGYAWGENVGWINFGHANCDAAINPVNGEFFGHAYGENIGWLKFKGASPDYGVRTLAFDTQAQGTPNWWLDHYGVNEGTDEGDEVPAWKEYVADTDPNNATSYFQVVSVSVTGTTAEVLVWPASTRRYYTLEQTESLVLGSWSNVAGQESVLGVGGQQALEDTGAGTAEVRYYRVEVSVSP